MNSDHTNRFSWLILIVVAFSGCGGINPVIDMTTTLLPFNSTVVSFQPGFEYLAVNLNGRKTHIALGHRVKQGDTLHEYWYSGEREMMHLANGRIVEVQGMTYEVRATTTEVPSWQSIADSSQYIVWSRQRDVMPGYRYGLVEYVISQKVTPSAKERDLIKNENAIWVEEEIKSKNTDGKAWIYGDLFAIVNDQVIYSQQCVSAALCFTLQPLGVVVKK
jgi:hypothetical protein